MARKRKKAPRARANGSGEPLAYYREEYNKLVPAAKKAGIKWARHHTSEFESRVKGAAQLKRLQDAIRAAK